VFAPLFGHNLPRASVSGPGKIHDESNPARLILVLMPMNATHPLQHSVHRHWGRVLCSLATLLMVAFSWAGQQDQPAGQSASQSALLQAVPAFRAADNVAIITIEGPIDAVTVKSVQRRIEAAERSQADAIVFELNTPGGEVGAVLEICSAIDNSTIGNTVAWIRDNAYSGGAIIAMACREIIVTRSSSFGDAKVVGFSPIEGMIEPGDVQKEKIYPVLFERIDAFTKKHNQVMGYYARDELLSQAIIADDAELWWIHDTKTGISMAIDRAEFERLYPDQPVLQPILADAVVGSVVSRQAEILPSIDPPAMPQDPESTPPGASESDSADGETAEPQGAQPSTLEGVEPTRRPRQPQGGFTPASPDVERFRGQIEDRISISDARESLRPVIDFNDPGRYRLEAKLLSGRGAVVLGSDGMARFGFASNADLSGTRAEPITTDEQLKAFFLAKNLERLDATWSEGLVRFMTSLPVQGLLVVVFLLGLFIEMTSPGMVLPGTIALIALAGLIVPPFLIGAAEWWAIAAILGGILLILLEVFVFPGFGIPGAMGLFGLLVGLLGLFVGPSDPQFPGVDQRGPDLLYALATLLLSGGVSIAGMVVVAKNFGRLPIMNHLILRSEHDPDQPTLLYAMAQRPRYVPGQTGRTITTLRPAGRVELDAVRTPSGDAQLSEEPQDALPQPGSGGGELIDVVAGTGYIDSDTTVRIVSVDGFRVVVEPVT
jgi:membrane-bound serine protease (ClpP class)